MVLEQRNQSARKRDGGSVQHVHVAGLAGVGVAEADVEAARLKVGTVRRTRDLSVAPAVTARHPGLDVVGPCGLSGRVTAAEREHAEGKFQSLKDPFLDLEDLLEHGFRFVRMCEGEKFHLAELVHAVESATASPGRSGFHPETVRKTAVAER